MQAGFTPLVPFSGVPSAVKQAAATKRDVWLDPVLAPSLALAPRWARGERRGPESLEPMQGQGVVARPTMQVAMAVPVPVMTVPVVKVGQQPVMQYS